MQFLDQIFVVMSSWLRGLLAGWGIAPNIENLLMILVYLGVLLGLITVNALAMILLERKISGYFQQRPGPNRLGPGGMFQTVADALKLLTKEDIIPCGADRWVFTLGATLIFVPAVMVFAVIPFGRNMTVVDLNIGIFYFISVSSLTTICFLMAGWGSNNKYSLLGAMRAVAQMISYEIPLGFSILGVIMLAGSLRTSAIVAAQSHVWFVILQPVAFIVYFIAATAELNRAPFDLPEGEQELVAGVYTEYTGMRWALFFLAEYTNLLSVSAIAVTLFFGGWQGPWLPSWMWFSLKVGVMIFVFMWIRWTFPRIRIDHLMNLSWKVLIPVSVVNILITGAAIYLERLVG